MKTDSTRESITADPSWRVAIIYSDFYKEEMAEMVGHAKQELKESGINEANITLFPVAGSFEIPLIGSALAKSKQADALIGLGIIVEGQTHHARLVAENSARGIMDVQVQYAIPFVNEVLYVDDIDLAKTRLSKGKDAARTAVESLALLARLQS